MNSRAAQTAGSAGAGAWVRGGQGNFHKSGFILVQMVCPKGCATSAHEGPTCGDQKKEIGYACVVMAERGTG